MGQPYAATAGPNLTMEIGLSVPTAADVDREHARLMAPV